MPEIVPSEVVRLYRPSNGTEGEMFRAKFCERCALLDVEDEEFGMRTCAILGDVFAFQIQEKEYPKQWCYDDDGKPTCTAFLCEPIEPPDWLTEDYDE